MGPGERRLRREVQAGQLSALTRSRMATLLPNGVPRYIHIWRDVGADRFSAVSIAFTGRYRHSTQGLWWELQGHGQQAGHVVRHVKRPGPPGTLWGMGLWKDLAVRRQAEALRIYCILWDLPLVVPCKSHEDCRASRELATSCAMDTGLYAEPYTKPSVGDAPKTAPALYFANFAPS